MQTASRPGGSISSHLEALGSRPKLHMRISRWETVLYGVSEQNKQAPDKQQIKFDCIWQWSPAIEVGDDQKENIFDTQCVVLIATAEDIFARVENDLSAHNQTCVEFFQYTPSSDKNRNAGWANFTVFMGGQTLRELARLLTLSKPDVVISVTLRAAYEADAQALTLMESGSYKWSGKGALEVIDIAVQVKIGENEVNDSQLVSTSPDTASQEINSLDTIQMQMNHLAEVLSSLEESVTKIANASDKLLFELRSWKQIGLAMLVLLSLMCFFLSMRR